MLDIFYWYALSIAMIFVLLFLRWFIYLAIPYLPCLRSWLLNHLVYPLLIPRRKWTSVAYIDAAGLAVYCGANFACLIVDVHSRSDVMLRLGLMSSVNMVPLFLGGHTSTVADGLGIPLHVYYLAHHWIGRMFVVQALVHSGLAIYPREWTWDRKSISGVAVGCSH
jgi:hypothetical protein